MRLVIKSPSTLSWQQNFNGGGDVDHESGADARLAQVTLYHDGEHPSYLELPLAGLG